MNVRRAVGLAAVVLVAVSGLAWAMGWGPFSDSLDSETQAVVDAVGTGEHTATPPDAAQFVDDNLDDLLSGDVADAVAGQDLADLFELALQDEGTTTELLGRVASAVAEDGEIHSGSLRRVFAEAVAANMGWVGERVNAPFEYTSTELPERVAGEYLDLHDFLRETMRDRHAARTLRRGLDEFGLAETSATPDSDERALRLARIGRVQRFFFEAQSNAEAAARSLSAEDATDRAVWLVRDLFDSPTPVGDEIREAARGRPFVGVDGALDTDLSQDEAQALRDWAPTLTAEGGPLWSEDSYYLIGAAEVSEATAPVTIENRTR